MKKLFTTALLIVTTLMVAQVKTTKQDYIGRWVSDQTSVETLIWKDGRGIYKILEFDTNTGSVLTSVYFKVNKKGNLETKSIFEPKNYESVTEFVLVDKKHMKAIVTGKYSDTFIMTKID